MSKTLKFEFDFDEVFEGIKLGVIKEMSEMTFDDITSKAINEVKSEVKNKISLTYKDEYEIRDEIKKEIKEKVFKTLIDEVSGKYLNQFDSYIETQLMKNPDRLDKLQSDIKENSINKLYNDLYSDIQYQVKSKINDSVSQLINAITGNGVKIKNTKETITKEEYDNLVHRDEMLTALEDGGVDNWEWYGDSLKNYFKNEED